MLMLWTWAFLNTFRWNFFTVTESFLLTCLQISLNLFNFGTEAAMFLEAAGIGLVAVSLCVYEQ